MTETPNMAFYNQTHFSGLSRKIALLVLIAVVALIVYGVFSYHPSKNTGQGEGVDLDCYRAIIKRIHLGEGYYKAAGEELHRRGYPTESLFNWRMPLLATILGKLPNIKIAKILAIMLAFLTVLIWVSILLKKLPVVWRTFGCFLVLDPITYSLSGDVFLSQEFWAGTLISLSLAAYAKGWRLVAVCSGLAALFLRELAIPFVVAMLLIALAERKRVEALAWSTGTVVFVGELFFHWIKISGMVKQGSLALKGGWVVFGGWPFVLSTSRMDPYLLFAPPWVAAVILPLLLIGFLGWKGELGLRVGATVGAYVLMFLFVGLPFNQYWGMMYSSIMLLGLLAVPHSFRDLWESICRSPKSNDS
jgi:hypothetical protein